MPVMTVNGLVGAGELGIIAPHEHILIDFRCQFTQFAEVSKKHLSEQKVSIKHIDILSRNPWAMKDNFLLDDVEAAMQELNRFKEAGGRTVVDVTNIGLGRDPEAIRKVGNFLGLHVVMGCGYYTAASHPPDMDQKKIADIEAEMIRDIRIGVGDTGIRAGIIGEIGTSEEIHPNEKKALIAAAHVQKETGLAMHVHTYSWGQRGLEILDILEKNQADIRKVCIDHVDLLIDLQYCEEIIRRGACVEFENMGREYTVDGVKYVFARDLDKIHAILKLIERGYISNILISTDVCLKINLHMYGGWGYDHVLTNILPIMRRKGITEEQIDRLVKDNPRKFLDVEEVSIRKNEARRSPDIGTRRKG